MLHKDDICKRLSIYPYISSSLLMSPFAGFSIAVNVTQTPSIFLLSRTGEPAVLHCVHDAADHYYLYWYRQVRDGGLTLIAYSSNKDDEQYEAGFESSFTIHRPEVKRSSFEIKSVKSEDTGVYFCASSITLTQNCITALQKLTHAQQL
ncbi:hypothetical protein AOXY_G29753 [Acipenser oxyrinchus oxyrinchus]|uniref:Ig-like domain-containing protein n=1 Tax=Acipenser oxyrinchus oxyrinchus TaxID=40147 RepID=A0AAD8CP07_ACIOX|nr:hypothetical protein AOXY_G29753 [Acipenser oxyrinchus oxyrinchus]